MTLRRATEEIRVYPDQLALVGRGQVRELIGRNDVGTIQRRRERGTEGGYNTDYVVMHRDGTPAFSVHDIYAEATIRALAEALGVPYST